MTFKDFASSRLPLKHPVNPNPKPKRKLEWVKGAKFKRPENYILGGQILTVSHIIGTSVFAIEDGLWTSKSELELVA